VGLRKPLEKDERKFDGEDEKVSLRSEGETEI